ncbi:MAG: hypothetical protein M9952_09200 [Microthrixaceae bacterium]|nr:hypothetical protein [Microthrixaceae bacterium]
MIWALAATAGYGAYLLYTAYAFRWSGLRLTPSSGRLGPTLTERLRQWMRQAGIEDVEPREFVAVTVALAAVGAVSGFLLFGGVLAPLAVGAFVGSSPVASYRVRRANRRATANDAWPQLIEEIRVLTGAAGRSIPQALLEVGRRGPEELRSAFDAAHREWVITTDFERTVAVLKERLADPTADATCETLLVAHQIGGGDLDRRLAELAEDRRVDNLGRKDARAKQAGVRFARRFVIAVPIGMAVAGMSLGDGRASYQSASGQIMVALGLSLVALCWVWSGAMLKLPDTDRVFD